MLAVFEHPLLSVTVTVYNPAERLNIESVTLLLLQLYVYGAVPPLGIILILPLLALQSAGVTYEEMSIFSVLLFSKNEATSVHPLLSVISTSYSPEGKLFTVLDVLPLFIQT